MFGIQNEVPINILNDNFALISGEASNSYIQNTVSPTCMCMSIFVSAYTRLKLYEAALEPHGRLVLHFNTDSVVYLSPSGDHGIHPDTPGAVGLWTLETVVDD